MEVIALGSQGKSGGTILARLQRHQGEPGLSGLKVLNSLFDLSHNGCQTWCPRLTIPL